MHLRSQSEDDVFAISAWQGNDIKKKKNNGERPKAQMFMHN